MSWVSETAWPSLTYAELEDQITLRGKLRGQMVGTLYPDILLGEIARLGHMKAYILRPRNTDERLT